MNGLHNGTATMTVSAWLTEDCRSKRRSRPISSPAACPTWWLHGYPTNGLL